MEGWECARYQAQQQIAFAESNPDAERANAYREMMRELHFYRATRPGDGGRDFAGIGMTIYDQYRDMSDSNAPGNVGVGASPGHGVAEWRSSVTVAHLLQTQPYKAAAAAAAAAAEAAASAAALEEARIKGHAEVEAAKEQAAASAAAAAAEEAAAATEAESASKRRRVDIPPGGSTGTAGAGNRKPFNPPPQKAMHSSAGGRGGGGGGANKKSATGQFTSPFVKKEEDPDRGGGAAGGGGGNHDEGSAQALGEKSLANLDQKLIDLIENEIMDHNPGITEIVIYPQMRPDLFQGLSEPTKGVLLFGPPGTGKTMLAKCIASSCKSTFFSISSSSLTSKWVGEGEKLVRALFAIARTKLPAVIFMDEVDSLLSKRSDDENEGSRRIKTEFLVQLDGAASGNSDVGLLIVARIYIPLPDTVGRSEFLKHGWIFWIRLEGLVQKRRRDEIPAVSMKHLEKALSRVRSSVQPSELVAYEAWNDQFGSKADD
eukprot:gene2831-6379_t